MIRAVQAMVPQNGVDYYDVISYGPIRGGHAVSDNTMCEVVGSSNFFSVVVTNDADDSLVGNLDVSVTFDEGENGVSLFCILLHPAPAFGHRQLTNTFPLGNLRHHCDCGQGDCWCHQWNRRCTLWCRSGGVLQVGSMKNVFLRCI